MSIRSIPELFEVINPTREVRRGIVSSLLDGRPPDPKAVDALQGALEGLEGVVTVHSEGGVGEIPIDLSYEVSELEKDIVFVRGGTDALMDHLASLHEGFHESVRELADEISGAAERFRIFATDRDGTVNNYCGRYNSSIQSAYNAYFLSVFAEARVEIPIILTSASLSNVGLMDMSVIPGGIFILAGSKGREFLGKDGQLRTFPIPPEQKEIIERLNAGILELVSRKDYRIHRLIGSGVQFKYGQTTVARQDISGTIPPEASERFLGEIEDLVRSLDEDGRVFRIEDTGKDIEIILTIEGEGGEKKDFDKGDGILFIAEALGYDPAEGPHLVAGDTSSDLPMAVKLVERSGNTRTVFVTKDAELTSRVKKVDPSALFVPTPDHLVTALFISAGSSPPSG